MNIVICGAGVAGLGVAHYLSLIGHTVTLIDDNKDVITKAIEELDCKGIVGFASNPQTLQDAGVGSADVVLASTSSDEVNMVTCRLAHSIFNVPLKIARIRNQNYLEEKWSDIFNRETFSIDIILSPEKLVAKAITESLAVPQAFDVLTLLNGEVELLGIRLPEDCPLVDTAIFKLKHLFPGLKSVIIAVNRGGKLFVPKNNDHLEVGDEVYYVVDKKDIDRSLKAFGFDDFINNNIVVIGGNKLAEEFITTMERANPHLLIKLIDPDIKRCETIASKAKNCLVIHGNSLDKTILEQVQVQNTDTVVCLHSDDQNNILSSMLCKRMGAKMTLATIHQSDIATIAPTLGIDGIITPTSITNSAILQYIHRGKMQKVYSIFNGFGEVFEAIILEGSPISGKEISEISLPNDTIIAFTQQSGKLIIPHSETVLNSNDKIIVFTTQESIQEMENLISMRL